jgi:hypothetical protein
MSTGFDRSRIILNRKRGYANYFGDYLMRDFITPAMRARAAQVTAQVWNVPSVLDQGATPHCVGYAWATYGIAFPVPDAWDNSMGEKIYYAAKVIDGEPGQEDGSTTQSGVQAFMQFSQLQNNSYAFATNLQDIITWVLANGPVVVGTNWYNNMFNPSSSGLVTIAPNDTVAGGHEYTVNGVDTIAGLFYLTNSWGTSWANGGHFLMDFATFQRLQTEGGDCCTASEVTGQPTPTPTPTPTPVPVPPAPGCSPISKLFR